MHSAAKPHLALLVPDGVGVRNFLINGFLDQADVVFDTTVLHSIPDSVFAAVTEGIRAQPVWLPLAPQRDSALSYTLRNTLQYAHMHWADTRGMRYFRSLPSQGSLRRRVADQTARFAGRASASVPRMRRLDRWHCAAVGRFAEANRYRELFTQRRPSIVFCSHQRPLSVLPAILAAKSLGIPTATFIFSWDNLTNKGRIAAPFDFYLVWSEHMRNELLRYYPDVAPARVHVVGTPQFDPYADPSLLMSRQAFFESVGADPSRPLICYSGGDAGNYPPEHRHVVTLLDAIRAGHIAGAPQVLLRPAPVDDGARYKEIRSTYPELIYSPPRWAHTQPGVWSQVMPLRADLRLLANLTHHADVNISLASTMTLDFAIHDKPVVNVAFDPDHVPVFGVPLWEFYYQFEHYKPVVALGAVRCARSVDELVEHVNAYLTNPALDRDNRRQLVGRLVHGPIGQAGARIVDTLSRLAASPGRGAQPAGAATVSATRSVEAELPQRAAAFGNTRN